LIFGKVMTPGINLIIENFNIPQPVNSVKQIKSGHIHSTYLVRCSNSSFILQNINHFVFRNVTGLMENISRVCSHLEKKISRENLHWIPVKPVLTHHGNSFIYYEDHYWRMFNYIPHASVENNSSDPLIVFEAGKAYGDFIRLLSDLPGKPLNETIPRFHDLDFRYKNFLDALKNGSQDRLKTAASETEEVLKGIEAAEELQQLIRGKNLPLRTTHNDTKITNILFDNKGKAICVIDLDTVMPGILHFDFGDSMRTFGNTAAEDEKDLEKVTFNMQAFKHYTKGFMKGIAGIITKTEIETLAMAPYFITCEQAVRFLTDYLLEDQYYHVDYPEHNLVRTRAQLALMKKMGENQGEMEKIILNK